MNRTEWIPRSDGCMGNELPGYWRVTLATLDGGVVMDCDEDKSVAEFKAAKAMSERNAFAALPPLEQLDRLCHTPHMCHNDMVAAIKHINTILQSWSKHLEQEATTETP